MPDLKFDTEKVGAIGDPASPTFVNWLMRQPHRSLACCSAASNRHVSMLYLRRGDKQQQILQNKKIIGGWRVAIRH